MYTRQSLTRTLHKSHRTLLPAKSFVQVYQPSTSQSPSSSLSTSPLLYSTKASNPKQMFPLPQTKSSCSVPSSIAKSIPKDPVSQSDPIVHSIPSDKPIYISSTTLVPGTLSCGPVSMNHTVSLIMQLHASI